MNKVKVLMVGSETTIKGGMTTVVLKFLKKNFQNIEMKYIPTHFNDNNIISTLKFLVGLKTLKKSIKKSQIVHIHMSERGSFIRKYIVFKIAKKNQKRVILHMHGAEFKEYYSTQIKFIQNKIINLLEKSDCVIALGQTWKSYFESLSLNINVIVVQNAIEINNFKVNLDEEVFNITFLAIIDKRKGIYDLIKVAQDVLENNNSSKKIRFLIAGSGKEEANIKKILNNYKLKENFQFLGWINDEKKHQLLKQSHLFVLPSYNEGLPMSILEAMSYGLPIISTDVGSINEAVFENQNGNLINPGDLEALRRYILKYIDSGEEWKQKSNKSKELCLEKFDIELYYKKFESLYLELVMEENLNVYE